MVSGPEHVLLLTGPPGIGKTTLLRRVAASLGHRPIGGFTTEEIRQDSRRLGFRIETFDGTAAVLAHVDYRSGPSVGRYGVDLAALERIARAALSLEARTQAYLVDEIGRMECLSPAFVTAMTAVLESDRPVVATVAGRGTGFIETVKRRPDARLWTVDRRNRDLLVAGVLEWLQTRLPA